MTSPLIVFKEILNKLLDAAKWLVPFFYIRNATKTKVEKERLKRENATQKKQLDIASQPDLDADDLRERMRDDRF